MCCTKCESPTPCSCTPKPHPHAALIKAWADNPTLKLQCRARPAGKYCPDWYDIQPQEMLVWSTACEYRIKPEPKPDCVLYQNMYPAGISNASSPTRLCSDGSRCIGTIKMVVDSETGKLKAVELLK